MMQHRGSLGSYSITNDASKLAPNKQPAQPKQKQPQEQQQQQKGGKGLGRHESFSKKPEKSLFDDNLMSDVFNELALLEATILALESEPPIRSR